MISVSNYSKKLSSKLGTKLGKSEEEIEVLNYGLFIVLHNTITIIIILGFGIITKMLYEILIIGIVSALFKRYSGGVHASSPERCTAISLIFSLVLALACSYLSKVWDSRVVIISIILSFIVTYLILYKKCPVPSKNKPLKNENTRKVLRKKAFILTSILFVIEIILYCLINVGVLVNLKIIVIGVLLGMLLQIFVLTNYGSLFVRKIDNVLKIVI